MTPRPTTDCAASGGRAAQRAALLWASVLLLLLLPAQIGQHTITGTVLDWRVLSGTLGLVLLLHALHVALGKRRALWLVLALPLAGAALLVRLLFAGTASFSGRGFDSGFFMHLNAASARIAREQYPAWLLGALLLLGLLGALLVRVQRRPSAHAGHRRAFVASVGAALLLAGHGGMPEWGLASGARAWLQPPEPELDLPAARQALWARSPLLVLQPPPRPQLEAQAATPPRNLILLYLESGGSGMIDSAAHPGLMPNLARLVHEHGYLPWLTASSFITIEGITNTQCGTLLPFDHGSDSLAGFDQMVEDMICLGDVLHGAGYRQTFLGGADRSFAGKGRFLQVHGYDKVMGSEDWVRQGLEPRPGTWGVSDADLFDQALEEIARLRAGNKPWNLTLLTIGTHPPGFVYAECTPWKDGKNRFLNAVTCTDQLVGRWITALQARGWLDADTVLVITADHNFFPNPQMRALFGQQASRERRVPFIVLGHDLPPAAQAQGSGVDLAPTLLDLLGIRSNARFPLGRSLADPAPRLAYFPSRYTDVHAGAIWDWSDPAGCPEHGSDRVPGAQPLSHCEREELGRILRAQARTYSAAPVTLHCTHGEPLLVQVPADPAEPLTLRVSGAEQARRFTWHSRQRRGNEPGLYLLAFRPDGTLLRRAYAPPEEVAGEFAEPPDLDAATLLVAASRAPPDAPPPAWPAWLPEPPEGAVTALFDRDATGAPRLRASAPPEAPLTLDARTCTGLLGGA